MTHRTVAIIAVLIVFGLALASTGCVARAQQSGIRCDGYDRYSGTLRYSCAIIDYDKLAEIAPIFAGRGKVSQVWVRSDDPQVSAFRVDATWGDGAYLESKGLVMIPNGSQQTIFEFSTDGDPLQSVRIQELKPVSATDWKP